MVGPTKVRPPDPVPLIGQTPFGVGGGDPEIGEEDFGVEKKTIRLFAVHQKVFNSKKRRRKPLAKWWEK